MSTTTLPVGISRTVQYNNRYQRERDLPEDRHPAFTAHVGFRGESWAKNFRFSVYGSESAAFEAAVKWRALMVQMLGRAVRPPARMHGHFNKPGRRRSGLAYSLLATR